MCSHARHDKRSLRCWKHVTYQLKSHRTCVYWSCSVFICYWILWQRCINVYWSWGACSRPLYNIWFIISEPEIGFLSHSKWLVVVRTRFYTLRVGSGRSIQKLCITKRTNDWWRTFSVYTKPFLDIFIFPYCCESSWVESRRLKFSRVSFQPCSDFFNFFTFTGKHMLSHKRTIQIHLLLLLYEDEWNSTGTTEVNNTTNT